MKLDGSCTLGKKMPTSRGKQEGTDIEIVTCQVSVSQVHIDREDMDDLAGLPIGCSAHLYNEKGMPWQHMSILLPKRELQGTGVIAHRKDGEEASDQAAELRLVRARVSDIRFNLQPPREDQTIGRALLSFTLKWKAQGDEVEAVEDLLGRACQLTLTVQTPAGETKELFPGTKPGTDETKDAAGETTVEIRQEDIGKLRGGKVAKGSPSKLTAAIQRAATRRANRRGKSKGKA